jgi:hypothetical protein
MPTRFLAKVRSLPIASMAWLAFHSFLCGPGWAFEQAYLPIAFMSPENGLGVGAKWIARDPIPGWSRFDIHGYATTRAQFDIKAGFRHQPVALARSASGSVGWAWEPRWTLEGYDTPFSYYGPGNRPAKSHQLIYEPFGFQAKLENRLMPMGEQGASPWRMRFQVGWQWQTMLAMGESMTDSLRDAVLPPTTPGYSGGALDWWEIAFEYDSRDDEDLPVRGLWAGTIWGHSSPLADFDFGRGEVFAAAYSPLGHGWEVASKVMHRAVFGPAPFSEKPELGNRKLLRGIPDQRLRDNQAQALQGELRWGFPLKLPWIARYFGQEWQLAAFMEAGRVGPDVREVLKEEWHPAVGIGGRLLIHDRLGAMRGDLGFSEFGWGLYVDFNQAF